MEAKMKILAVDDDPLILQLLTEVLRVVGFTNLTTCESAHDALGEIERADVPFDCFLLDIQMPGMDGIELTRAIRKLPAHKVSPIVMITAMSDRSYIDNAFAAGASDYVTKPFEIGEVHARLGQIHERVLAHKQREDRNPVSAPRDATSIVTASDFQSRLPLSDIDAFVEYLALENYLFQVSRVSLFGMRAFGIVVPGLERAFQASSVYEYQSTVSDFAEAISDCLKPRSFLAAHAGSGEFVCVLTDGDTIDPVAFETTLCETIRDMDLHFCDGRAMTLEPVVGNPISLQLKSSRGVANVLVQALADAEAVARAPRTHRETAPTSALKQLFGW